MLSHMTRLRAVTMTALPILFAPACATLSTNVDPMARDAGVRGGAQVILYGTRDNIDNLTISQNDGRDTLKIVMVNNPTFGQVLKNLSREEIAKGSLQGQPAGTSASYTTTERISPAIYLNQKGTHTLHLVRKDGQQATVVDGEVERVRRYRSGQVLPDANGRAGHSAAKSAEVVRSRPYSSRGE